MKHKTKFLGFLIVILIFTFLFLIFKSDDSQARQLDEFAQCLSDKGIIMYGAEWCSHCQAQKELFDQSFRYINYVECPQDPQKCLSVGVEAYPTWLMPDGQKLVGEQSLETLSQKTTCLLPQP
ncbi:MAG: hypothetical protein HYV66_02070 [Candidatus Sungbacteria bacterium]|uniref:Thioredoxin domain-containing protein n=1 Tax=Candidatus Sungiibacteriota bacterium TaxID=2750080 RepID=A0A931YDS5_9BACT|nr:hypothetical protein [Candidatus Sungbacteria bacterium]